MFKKGQRVRVKSYDEIKHRLGVERTLIGESIRFAEDMERHCGEVFEVSRVFVSEHNPRKPRVSLVGTPWAWHPSWLVLQIIDNRSL